jgi:hydrogenase maturation protease
VLVAGVGNVFLGDDGFGVEVVRRLAAVDLPNWVRVADYGIRGMHLAYDIAGGDYELTIMVDATHRGDPPGTVYVIELDTSPHAVPAPTDGTEVAVRFMDAHGMEPDVVLNLIHLLGADPGRVLLVGCEPAVLDHDMRLSPAVAEAVDVAVQGVVDLLDEFGSEAESENESLSVVRDWC